MQSVVRNWDYNFLNIALVIYLGREVDLTEHADMQYWCFSIRRGLILTLQFSNFSVSWSVPPHVCLLLPKHYREPLCDHLL